MCEEGGDPVHDEWEPTLQLGASVQRGGCRGRGGYIHQGHTNRVDANEAQLGRKLGDKHHPCWPSSLFPCRHVRRSFLHLL